VSEVTPAAVVSIFASGFNVPESLAFDAAGNLYVVNDGNNTVSKVSESVTMPFTVGGTAVNGVDYSGVTASSLTFGIGQTTANITGTLLPDSGASKTLTVTLGTPTNATLGSPAVNTLTITETPPPSVSVAFGPAGAIVELVNSEGVLTQFDASGAHQLGNGGVRYASVAFGPNGEVLEVVSTAGVLTQFDATGVHQLGGGVQSASVAFEPNGEVLEVVSSTGVLTQFSAAGAQRLGGSGVESAGVAFTANSEVLDIIFSDGSLDQFDASGVHRLGMVS
jgi:hypothetical protein